MRPDTFDTFTPPDRGRFGENEERRMPGRQRVNRASDLVDLDMYLHVETEKAIRVSFERDNSKAQ